MMNPKKLRSIGLVGITALAGSMLMSCSEISGSAKPAASTNEIAPAKLATAPTSSGVEVVKTTELHNVYRVSSKLLSGAGPEGSAAFDELSALGIKTILSVDGSTPDLKAASARGMRYVHIPITYAEATKEQQLEIARAVRDLPGPIYLHCHHGKHRGPAAAASAAVLLGEMTSEQGVAFMKAAGTAPSYKGLYACVAMAATAMPAELDAAPAGFPSVKAPAGITAAMVSVDHAYEHLGLIRTAGWKVPNDHPDLVPAAEAGQLVDHLRFSGEDPKTKTWGIRFEEMLKKAIGDATALEDGLAAGKSDQELEKLWKPVAASCKDCHAVYRDAPGFIPATPK